MTNVLQPLFLNQCRLFIYLLWTTLYPCIFFAGPFQVQSQGFQFFIQGFYTESWLNTVYKYSSFGGSLQNAQGPETQKNSANRGIAESSKSGTYNFYTLHICFRCTDLSMNALGRRKMLPDGTKN